MTALSTHIDSVNGNLVNIVINAHYQTLVDGSSFAKGVSVKRFCAKHDSKYCKIIENQVWASQSEGYLLFALVDQFAGTLELGGESCMVYLPLDNMVYVVEIGNFGSCVPGSESIVALKDLPKNPPMTIHVLSGGVLSSEFENVLEFSAINSDFKYSKINKELIKNKLYVSEHYLAACVTALAVSAAIYGLPGFIRSQQAPVVEAVQEIVIPKGSDIAVSQLAGVDSALSDLDYFLPRGLHTLRYDVSTGITLLGNYTSSAVMSEMIDGMRIASIDFQLGSEGWSAVKLPMIEPRPVFDLGDFGLNFVVLQRLAEKYNFVVSMGTPITDIQKKSVQVSLSAETEAKPPLLLMAKELAGYAITVDSVEVAFKDHRYEFVRLTLNVSGKI